MMAEERKRKEKIFTQETKGWKQKDNNKQKKMGTCAGIEPAASTDELLIHSNSFRQIAGLVRVNPTKD